MTRLTPLPLVALGVAIGVAAGVMTGATTSLAMETTSLAAEAEEAPPDVCGSDDVTIAAADAKRRLYWSCVGIALDVPAGFEAERSGGDGLNGLTIELSDTQEPPRYEARLTATHLESPPKQSLASAVTDIVQVDNMNVPAVGPTKRTSTSLTRRYQLKTEDGRIAVVRSFFVLGLQQMEVVLTSNHLDAKALAKASDVVTKFRPISTQEWATLPPQRQWKEELVDRLIPVSASHQGGKTTHHVTLCKDGRYRVRDLSGAAASLGAIPPEGRWRMEHGTIQIDGRGYWNAGGVFDAGGDRLGFGPFGVTSGIPPFPPAGVVCSSK